MKLFIVYSYWMRHYVTFVNLKKNYLHNSILSRNQAYNYSSMTIRYDFVEFYFIRFQYENKSNKLLCRLNTFNFRIGYESKYDLNVHASV